MTLQPPPPFFGLWGVIFTGELAYVLAQAAPDWVADDMLNSGSGLYHAGALAATNLWGAVFQARRAPRRPGWAPAVPEPVGWLEMLWVSMLRCW